MTIAEFLSAHFEGSEGILGLDVWGDVELAHAAFVVDDGELPTDILTGIGVVRFDPADGVCQVWLVVDFLEVRMRAAKPGSDSSATAARPTLELVAFTDKGN